MILIAGAGAVGTILATHLAAAGRDVALYARAKDLARYGALEQMRVDPPDPRGAPLLAPRAPLVGTLDLAGVECLVICVKYPDLDGLLDRLPAVIPEGCRIVCTLNGVAPLRRLRERLPRARIVPMSVMMNGQLLGPLHARLATRAEIVIGSDDADTFAFFSGAGIAVTQTTGDAAVWGKLLINLANAICALTRSSFEDLLRDRALRRVYVAVLDEATRTMDASGIVWKLPLVVPYGAYRWMLLHGGPLPWWFAKYRNGVREGAYPSMVADVQAGRATEVEQLNGEIVRLGLAGGLPTPVNAALVAMLPANPNPKRAPMTPRDLRARLGL